MAILCQRQWLTPLAHQSKAVVVCEDRALARYFIQRTRADILRQLKTAFRELVMTETFYLEGDTYYATLGATQAGEDGNTNDRATRRKRRRTRTRPSSQSMSAQNPTPSSQSKKRIGSSSGRRVRPCHDTQAGGASAPGTVTLPPRHGTQAGGASAIGTVSPPLRNQVPLAQQRETHRSPSVTPASGRSRRITRTCLIWR